MYLYVIEDNFDIIHHDDNHSPTIEGLDINSLLLLNACHKFTINNKFQRYSIVNCALKMPEKIQNSIPNH